MTDQTPLEQIEEAAKFYAEARTELAGEMDALNTEIKALQAKHRSALIAMLDQAVNARAGLEALLNEHPSQFKKPKTRQMHGIKCGFRKAPGKVTFADDEAKVIARIREHLKPKAKLLIATKESVRKDVLSDLKADELASIGVSITDCGDEVFVKACDTDLDKLIKGLIKDDEFGADLIAQDRVL